LLVVYAMLITASAIPTMGLSEYLLTITTGAQYYATPENEWATLIGPQIADWMVPQSPQAISWFFEVCQLARRCHGESGLRPCATGRFWWPVSIS
tara:strand:+ start:623 stop:907 length:285 start_codon:yes stop_codon:yes gene_type:complete